MTTLVQYISVDAVGPSLQDNSADVDRLKKAVKEKLSARPVIVPFAQVTNVSAKFRQANFSGTAVVNDCEGRFELVDFIDGFPTILAAVALDLGTTHLEAKLINLLDGKVLAHANRENAQIQYGDDILTRIHYASRGNGLQVLHDDIIQTINELITALAVKGGVQEKDIRALSMSGNPTMVHFFLKLDPYNLCREPYIPVVNSPDICCGQDLGLVVNCSAPIYVMPSVGSYFGGDLISGILASNMDRKKKTSMLIDVGTNAEVVVGNSEWLIACAGAAGPALEGGVAKMGMRAGPGAIEHVTIDPQSRKLTYETIENQPACGICGSGIIDLVAGLYLSKLIDIRGKFNNKINDPRLQRRKESMVFTVVPAAEAEGGQAVELAQVDLDAMMRSKAAMYAILTTLVSQVGLSFSELDMIFVAGAFGRHIDPRQAVTLGMLPDLPISTYKPIGNSSLAGAEKVLLGKKYRDRCQAIMNRITYLELNVNQEFMMRFSGSKFIPHTDTNLFPSVPIFS